MSATLKEKMLHRFSQIIRRQGDFRSSELLSDFASSRCLEFDRGGFRTAGHRRTAGLSVKTIDSYREHLKLKLNLGTSSELVRYAIQVEQEPVT